MANAMSSASQRMARSRGFRAVIAGTGKLAGKAPIHEKTITVMTYNILAQKYAQSGWHQYCKPQHLQWKYRKARLLDEIESYGTDLICLQEVEAGVFARELQPWLAVRGYRGLYLARQYGDSMQGPPDGVALFYRTEVFELLKHHATIFTEAPTNTTSGSDTEEPPTGPFTSQTTNKIHSSTTAAAAVAVAVQSTTGRATDTAASNSSLSSQPSCDTECGSGARHEGLGTTVGSSTGNAGATAARRKGGSSGSGGNISNKTDGGGRRATARGGQASRSVVVAALGSGSTEMASGERGGGGVSTSGRATAAAGGGGGSNSNTSTISGGGGAGVGGEFWSVFRRRQEGAIMALIRHRPSQRLVLAAVTHLFWNPAYPDVKAFQAAVLCQEIASFLAKHSRCPPGEVPVVLAGDFNSTSRKHTPDAFDPKIPPGPEGLVSGVYSLLTSGSLAPDHPDHPSARRRSGEGPDSGVPDRPLDSAGLRLASAYCMALGREPPLTTRTQTFAGCLDYIFVSSKHFDVVRTLELPYEEPAQDAPYEAVRNPLNDIDFPAIPDAFFPSDHLAIAAELRLKG